MKISKLGLVFLVSLVIIAGLPFGVNYCFTCNSLNVQSNLDKIKRNMYFAMSDSQGRHEKALELRSKMQSLPDNEIFEFEDAINSMRDSATDITWAYSFIASIENIEHLYRGKKKNINDIYANIALLYSTNQRNINNMLVLKNTISNIEMKKYCEEVYTDCYWVNVMLLSLIKSLEKCIHRP
ncbi:MAG: hypothetical protein HQK81_09220 [Desulfovibrionaceae bacterium]|nr:hypothetical protein [Desulfovibrionaceae bacterium]